MGGRSEKTCNGKDRIIRGHDYMIIDVLIASRAVFVLSIAYWILPGSIAERHNAIVSKAGLYDSGALPRAYYLDRTQPLSLHLHKVTKLTSFNKLLSDVR